MALSIGGNYGMLRSLNNLRSTQSKMNKAMERISSGLRINSAADDAGGLAMGMKLSNGGSQDRKCSAKRSQCKVLCGCTIQCIETAADIVSEMKQLKTNYDAASADDKPLHTNEFENLQDQLTMLTGEKFNGECSLVPQQLKSVQHPMVLG